jgi:hypothetical protein
MISYEVLVTIEKEIYRLASDPYFNRPDLP